jgi:hypothetical protein
VARRLLRIASIGLASAAAFGLVFGGFLMMESIESWNRPGEGAAFLAYGAIVVWFLSGVVGRTALWSWHAPFNRAAVGLAIAGTMIGYLATLNYGDALTPWTTVALGLPAAMTLASAAAAVAVHRRVGLTSELRDRS